MKKNAALLMATLLVVFGIAEMTVRLLQQKHVIYDFSKGEHNAVLEKKRNFSPKLHRLDNPLLLVENEANQPGINQWGMRGPNIEKAKGSNVYRIAIVGDSVSFGYGVPYENSFAYLLEQKLNDLPHGNKKIEVLNFSVNGYGLESYVALTREKVFSFAPDMVLLGYCLNDPVSVNVMFEAVGDVMKKNAGYKQLAKYSEFIAWVTYMFDKAVSQGELERNFSHVYQDPSVLARLEPMFISLRDMTMENHSRLLVAVFPYLTDFNDYTFSYAHTVIGSMLARNSIEGLDLLPAFSTQSASLLRVTPDDVTHPNAKGHEIIADSLAPILRDRMMTTANPVPHTASEQ